MNPTSSSAAHRNIGVNSGGSRSVCSRQPRKLIRWAATLLAATFSATCLPAPSRAASNTDTWTAFTNSNWSTSAGDANWSIANVNARPFTNGDTTIFGDINPITNSYIINLSNATALTPSSVTVNTTHTYDFTGIGSLGSTATLTKASSGTLILDNSGTNANSGAITVSGGSLQLGNGDAQGNLGATTDAVSLSASTSTLVFDRTDTALSVANVISGTGSVTQFGTGTTTLTGANTYSGATTINAGTLKLSSTGSISSVAGASTTTNFTTNTAFLTVNNGATFALNGGSATFNTISGAGTIQDGAATASTLTLAATTASNTFAGLIQDGGAGKLSLQVFHGVSGGSTTLSGANTYSGGTTINGGTLAITQDAALGTGPLTFNGGTLQLNGYASTLSLGFAGSTTSTVSIGLAASGTSSLSGSVSNTGTGGLTYSAGTTTLSGPITLGATSTSDALTVTGGTLILTGSSNQWGLTTVNASTLQIGSGGTLGSLASTATATYQGTGAITMNGGTLNLNTSNNLNISNNILNGANTAANVTQSGTGTTNLSGSNTYFGNTTINAGTLQVGSVNALGGAATTTHSTVTINNTGILDLNGFGTTASSVVIGGLAGTTTAIVNNSAATTANLTIGTGASSTANPTYSGTIQNSGGALSIVKAGIGTETLTGANTYTGSTTIGAGILAITQDSAINNGAGGVTFSGGTLQLNANTIPNINPLLPPVAYTSNLAFGTQNANLGSTGVAALTSAGLANLSNTTTSTVFLNQGFLTGAGSLTYVGPGILNLNGTNTYTGGTTLTKGELAIGSLTSGSNAIDYSQTNAAGSALNFNGGTLQLTGASDYGTALTNNVNWATFNGGFDIVQTTGALEIANNLAGTGSLAKSGAGTLTINGNVSYGGSTTVSAGKLILNGNNSYTGGTIISGGILQAGSTSALGAAGGVVSMSSGATLDLHGFNATVGALNGTGGTVDSLSTNGATLNLGNGNPIASFGGVIQNTGGGSLNLVKVGVGVQTLSGVNTFSGGTTLDAGVLAVTADSALGAGPVSFSGGTLQLNNYSSALKFGNQSVILGANPGTASTIAGGFITGVNSMTYVGLGTLTLSGSNSYTNGTNINAGIIAIASDAAIGVSGANPNPIINFSGAGTLQFNNYTSNLNLGSGSQTVNLGANTGTASVLAGKITTTGNLTFNGPGTLALTGANSYGTTTITGGTLQVGNGGTSGTLGTGAIANGAALVFDRTDAGLVISTNITGIGTVTQLGSGTTTLSGTDSYTGGTTVTAGTLKLASTTALGNAANTVTFGSTSTGTVDLNGFNQSIGILSGASTASTITNSSATAATLTVGSGITFGNNYTDAGTISGSALGLTTAGGGTLTLTGTNTYGGKTTLGGTGVLAVGSDSAINNGAGGIVFSGGTLQFNNYASTALSTLTGAVKLGAANGTPSSLSSLIANGASSTSLTYAGPGILALTGNNTYTGPTTINGGELSISSASNINNGAGGVTIAGGTLQVNGQINGYNGNFSSLTFNPATANGLDITTGNIFQVASAINGSSFTKLGGGILQLTSNAQNQFGNSFIVNVDGGTIDLNDQSQVIGGLGGFGTIDTSGGVPTLNVGSTNLTSSFAGTIQNSFGTMFLLKSGTGTLTLSGNGTYSGSTNIQGGTLAIASDASINPALAFTGGVLQFNNYVSNMNFSNSTLAAASSQTIALGAANGTVAQLNGNITGSLGMDFVGPGTLVLGGNNTYTGGTTLTGGELSVSSQSNIANSQINFNSGTLQIAGTTLGSLTNTLTWLGSNTLDINNVANTFTVSSTIGGSALTKIGAGNLILTGNNSAGVGTITISAGTLQIGNGGTTGTLGTGGVTDNSLLVLDETGTLNISNVISGSGALSQIGTGTTILNGINTFTGGTQINAGKIQLGNANATLGAISSGAFVANGATLDINGFSLSLGGLAGNGLVTSSATSPTVVPTLTLGNGNPVAEFDGQITGKLAINQVGTGITTLTGNNTYSGGTTITGGTLAISQDAALGTGGLTFNGGALQLNNYASNLAFTAGAVKLGASGLATLNNNLTGATTSLTFLGNAAGGAGTLVLDGSNTTNLYGGGTTITSGTLQVGNGDTNGSLGSGAVTNNSSLVFDRSDAALSIANLISGTGTVAQSGSGVLTLAGANTYSGGTTVNSGTVKIGVASVLSGTPAALVSGALGTGPVTVNSAALVGLDLNGFSPTIGGLSGTGTIDNTSSTPSALTVDGNGNFSGTIQNSHGAVSLNLNAGTGTLSLSGTDTYTGGTTLTSGILAISSDAALGTGPLTFNGGTLLIGNYTSQLNFNNVPLLNLSASGTNSAISGTITGNTALSYSGNTTLFLNNSNNNYTGGTTINSGTIVLGGSGGDGSVSFGLGSQTGALVLNGGELGLNAHSATIGSLAGTGFIDSLAFNGDTVFNDTLTVGGNNTSTTFAGQILNTTGTLALNKIGTGTLTLSGTNTYGGGTTITNGVLAITSDSALGNPVTPTSSATFAGGTLQFVNYNSSNLTTLTGPVSLGAAAGTASSLATSIADGSSPTSLTYVGPGTLVLDSYNNTYTGATTIAAGTLAIPDDSNINFGIGGVKFTGGTLQLMNYASNLSFNTSPTLGAATGTPSSLTGIISDASGSSPSSLTFVGPGILALTSHNTYTGVTNINGGELSISAANNISSNAINFGGGALQITGAIGSLPNTMNWTAGTNNGLDVTTGNSFAVNSPIGGANFSSLGGGTLVLNAANTYTGSTTISGGGLVQLKANTAALPSGTALTITSGTLDLNGNNVNINGLNGAGVLESSSGANTVTLSNSTPATFTGTIQNAITLAMSGTGIQTLSGTNTYSGGTSLNSGTLAITQDTAVNSGNVTFNGGTLQLNADNSSLIFGAQNVKLGAAGGAPSSIGGNAGFLTGNSSLTYVGPGTLTLNGSNAYTGGTTIQNGTLAIGSDPAINSGIGGVTFSGGALQLNNYSSNLTFTAGNAVTLGAATGAPATLAATGALSGASSLSFVGPGTLVVAGANTYTGGTNINGGELSINALNQINYSTTAGSGSPINFNGGTLQITGNTITGQALTNNVNWATFNGGFDIASTTNSVTLGNVIAGSGSLAKLGAGTLVVSAANTYTGGTVITAGTLQLSGTGTLGSTVSPVTMTGGTLNLNAVGLSVGALVGTGTITNSATTASTVTLGNGAATTSSSTFAGTISGPVNITKSGTGTQVLSGTNTYTGTTTINQGVLQLGSANALGTGTGTVTLNAAASTATDTLDLHGFSPTIVSLTSGSNTTAQVIDDLSSTPSTLTIAGTSSTVSSIIKSTTGAITLVSNGTGTLTLNGASTYTGGTIVNAGTLVLGNTTALGAATGSLTINSGASVNLNNNSPTVGILSGVGTIGNSASTSRTLTVSTSSNSTFAGIIGGSVGANLNLVKAGTGTLTLTGNNTYNAGTTISAGTLAITSDAAINSATNPQANVTFSGGTLQFVNYNSNITFNNNVASIQLGAATGAASSLNGAITGNTTLTYVGPGILALNGNNNYTGGTNINGGELSINSLNNVGGPTNNTLINGLPINPGAINFNGGLLQVTGNGIQNLNSNAVNWGTFTGGFDIASPSNVFTINTQIGRGASNGGTLTKAGPGTVILTASGAVNGNNTSTGYTGATTITGGLLQIGDGGADGSIGSGNVSFGSVLAVEPAGNPLLAAGSPQTLAFNSSLNITYAGAISGVGQVVQEGSGILSLTGTSTFTGGVKIIGNGTLPPAGTPNSNYILSATSDAALGATSANPHPLVTFVNDGELLLNNNTTAGYGNSNLTFGSQNIVLGVTNNSAGTGVTLATGNFLTGAASLTFEGPGTLSIANPTTYSGGTIINGGKVWVESGPSGNSSDLGTGPVTVNTGGELGTPGSTNGAVTGIVTVNSGGTLAPGDPATLTLGGLILNSGSNLNYAFNQGTATAASLNTTSNDLTTTGSSSSTSPTLTLSPNVNVNVITLANFGNSATNYYAILHAFDGLTPGSTTNYSGWIAQFSGAWTPGANTYADFQTGTLGSTVFNDLRVYNSPTAPTITPSTTPEFVVQAKGQKVDFYQGGSDNGTPAVTAPVQDGNGVTTYTNSNFYLVNQTYTGATNTLKTNSFQAISSTILVSAPNVQANPAQLYNTGFEYLAAQIAFVDPPATAAPFYIGETFNNPGGLSEIIPAVQSGGNWDIASSLDTQTGKTIGGVVDGSDSVQGYNGSFLAYIDSLGGPFASITDPGNLTANEWTELDGSYGVDFSNDIAWSVLDYASGTFTVVGGPTGSISINATPLPRSLTGGLILMLGMGFMAIRKMRRAA